MDIDLQTVGHCRKYLVYSSIKITMPNTALCRYSEFMQTSPSSDHNFYTLSIGWNLSESIAQKSHHILIIDSQPFFQIQFLIDFSLKF